MNKQRKDSCYMYKVYDKSEDGVWEKYEYRPNLKIRYRLTKDCRRYILEHQLKDIVGHSVKTRVFRNDVLDVPKDRGEYMVKIMCLKDSRMMNAYKSLGFEEFKEKEK